MITLSHEGEQVAFYNRGHWGTQKEPYRLTPP